MPVLLIIIGLILLYFGAEWLVRGAVSIARRLGISPLVIGLTIVAYGTSAPEMTVSIQSALAGQGDIAAANVIGSNIFNIAVILGLTALICPINIGAPIIRLDMPAMIAVSVAGWLCLADRRMERWEGLILIAGAIAYTAWAFYRSRQVPVDGPVLAEVETALPARTDPTALALALIIGGLIALVFGSKALVTGATQIARFWGVSDAVIGLTIVSAGTSLPELATSVVAAKRRQSDIAVGNVVGSNIFNILAILGTSALLVPYSAPGIQTVDLVAMFGLASIALPFMWSGFVLARWEGGVLLMLFGAYLAWLWPK